MTEPEWPDRTTRSAPESGSPGEHSRHGGHGWMMIACCIPMLVIAVALVATGVASPSFLIVAVMCTAMMAMMMGGMHGGGSAQPPDNPPQVQAPDR